MKLSIYKRVAWRHASFALCYISELIVERTRRFPHVNAIAREVQDIALGCMYAPTRRAWLDNDILRARARKLLLGLPTDLQVEGVWEPITIVLRDLATGKFESRDTASAELYLVKANVETRNIEVAWRARDASGRYDVSDDEIQAFKAVWVIDQVAAYLLLSSLEAVYIKLETVMLPGE